jgi:uncharacterized protein YdcH (DUF465 family)
MTNYRHPKNNPDSCPCNITKYDDCRNADDIEIISYEDLKDYTPSDLIVLPSGQCITKDNLSLMETWKDPFTNKALSFDNEFCDMSEACVRGRDQDRGRERGRDQAQWQAIIEEHQRLAARPEMQERFRNRQIQQEEEELQEQRLQLYQNGVDLIMGIIFTILGIAGQSARNIIRNFIEFLRFLYGLGYQGGLTLAAVIYIQLLFDPNVIVLGTIVGAVNVQPILAILQRIVAIMNFFGQNGGTSLSTSNNNTIKTTQETVVNNLTKNIKMKPEKVVKNLTTNINKILKLKTNDKKSMEFITSINELKSIINDTQFVKTLNYKEKIYSITGNRKTSIKKSSRRSGTKKSSIKKSSRRSGTKKSSIKKSSRRSRARTI